MTVRAKHTKTSSVPDGGDTSQVRPSDWNADHAIKLSGPALVGSTTSGDGDATEITLGTGLSFSGSQLIVSNVVVTSGDQSIAGVKNFTGASTALTAAVGTNTTQIATTAFVNAEIANDAVLLGSTNQSIAGVKSFTGASTALTAAVGTNTTQIATTAFVQAEIANDAVLLSTNQSVAGDKTFSGTTALTAASTVDSQAIGYRDIPQVIQNASATFALTDRGDHWIKTNTTAYTWTIPLNSSVAFPIGTAIVVINDSGTGAVTIARTAGVALLDGATDANYTLATNTARTLLKVGTDRWRIL